MSQKTNKELRRKVKQIQVEWMHTLLPKEEADKITIKNIEEVLPKQQYYVSDRTMYLSFMNTKWVLKYLKKYPSINSFEELNSIYETERNNKVESKACRSIL